MPAKNAGNTRARGAYAAFISIEDAFGAAFWAAFVSIEDALITGMSRPDVFVAASSIEPFAFVRFTPVFLTKTFGTPLAQDAPTDNAPAHRRRRCDQEPNVDSTRQLTNEDKGAARVLTLATTAFTLLFAVWLMLGVLAVPIKAEFGLDKVQFSWLTAIAILSGSLWRLPFGLWADRVGGRVATTTITLITAVPCLLTSYAHSYDELIVYALFFGLAGNSFTSGVAWTSAWFSASRQGVALGTFGAGNVGASVTKLIGPTLIALVPAAGLLGGAIPGDWRFVPVLYTVLLVIMAVALWTLSPTPDRKPGAGRSLSELLRPLSEGRVWRFGLYYVVVFGAYVALSVWMPNYYASVFKLGLGSAALLTALFIFPASLLRPLGGFLSDRFGARTVTYATFVVMTLASLLLSVVDAQSLGLWGTFALVEVLGIGMGVGKASVYKYVPSYYPRDVGAVGGVVGTLGGLGGFLLPLGFGYLEQITGRAESCFWAVGFVTLTSLLALSVVVSALKREQRSSQASGLLEAAE
jgi:NNP family nitrate/nitrite transporter-like MFS transporter